MEEGRDGKEVTSENSVDRGNTNNGSKCIVGDMISVQFMQKVYAWLQNFGNLLHDLGGMQLRGGEPEHGRRGDIPGDLRRVRPRRHGHGLLRRPLTSPGRTSTPPSPSPSPPADASRGSRLAGFRGDLNRRTENVDVLQVPSYVLGSTPASLTLGGAHGHFFGTTPSGSITQAVALEFIMSFLMLANWPVRQRVAVKSSVRFARRWREPGPTTSSGSRTSRSLRAAKRSDFKYYGKSDIFYDNFN
ncbi:hypothetical protein ZWY2020_032963 [Hordeum vulgare]|nr:hypothetical protein ZWY2020_032963 [Hordeum vulgare]